MNLGDITTPFNVAKTAPQEVQFGIDPSRGLTRKRYYWKSNGTLFDGTNVSNGEGEIEFSTGASGTDSARIRSAFAGQYVSQGLAQPGIKFYVNEAHVTENPAGLPALTHGNIKVGPYTYRNGEVKDGFGLELTPDGMYAFWKYAGSHKGDSPVPQGEWDTDDMDAQGVSGIRLSPVDGYVFNFPYTWYNAGRLALGVMNPSAGEVQFFHTFNPPRDSPGSPSTATPNLPINLRVDNNGTAESLSGAIGGMQYTLYGAESGKEVRESFTGELDVSFGSTVTTPLSPTANPGDPLYAVKRQPAYDTVELKLSNTDIEPSVDAYLYIWDEWNPAAALTDENFVEPFGNFSSETRSLVDTSATAFDASNAVLKNVVPLQGGTGSKEKLTSAGVDSKIPLDATRVVTIIGKSNTGSVDFIQTHKEGF